MIKDKLKQIKFPDTPVRKDVVLGGQSLTDEMIDQIVQIFEEEGYVKLKHGEIPMKQDILMTGAEWYLRFLNEIINDISLLRSSKEEETVESMIDYILGSAKKASKL